uniref:NADH-ubiquinone oxidoreductase chain 4L n=1 Tax=Stereobalanus canadensis TaxID=560612 RepID=A0A3Q8HCL4_9BILA|nr:NADH dehydrogenase subunit 4L [Stereobalanus canadensis]AXY64129.1 NADH dehydrogenase subunit 4L [Stereobalanus canadensis]
MTLHLPMLTFLMGSLSLITNQTHLLSTLLSLELLLMSLFSGTALWTITNTTPSIYMIMPLLALSACEASVGLALLVSLSRSHGSDLTRNMNLLKC